MNASDEFQYLTVLVSIILGLGVTQLLTGVGRLVQLRQYVRPYWPVFLWIGLLLLIHIQSWWAMFEMRDHEGWTFAAFLIVLLHPISLYLMAALLLPDVAEAAGGAEARGERSTLDLRSHYFAQVRWFAGAALGVIVTSMLRPVVLDGHFPLDLDRALQSVFLLMAAGAMIVRRPRYHESFSLLGAVLFVGYVAALFTRLS